jgi:nucleotide-binding universal stress UspA family protein
MPWPLTKRRCDMYQHILLAVPLQRWEEYSPHALAARDASVAIAKGSGAKLSVLSVYDYEKLGEPGLPGEMAARYREDLMRRTDATMEAKMKAFLVDIQGHDLPITPLLKVGEPRKTIITTVETLQPNLLIIGAHSKRSVFDVTLGGTAAYVSRHAPCTVLMVKPSGGNPTSSTNV